MDWYIGSEWKLESKGLSKQVLALDFNHLERPHQVSKVLVQVDEVQQLNDRASKYLGNADLLGQLQEIEMGMALTPVDCYVELLLREMIVGESARCCINTKACEKIIFVVKLEKIINSIEIHKLNVGEMYALALRYKANGVTMFTEYPTFAHDYFARAAKCLISYQPFEDLTAKRDGVAGSDMQTLFIQIKTNLAACLLTQKRFHDVIYLTEFVESMTEPSEKSIYRRALAYCNIKEFEKAQKTIEKVPNYGEKKDFAKLHVRILEDWKLSNDEYKHVVQRMFS